MNNQELTLLKAGVVDVVAYKVRGFVSRGELNFPADYDAETAMKSAWLTLQEAVDRNGNPVLQTCTKNSIANALLNLLVQGLNTAKNQAYFIAYGDKLVMQRSYFGSIALAKRADSTIEDILGQVVYEGDEFEYQIRRGKTYITKHVQRLQNVDKSKIIAAYATVLRKNEDASREYSVVKTMDEIKQAWRQSKMNPLTENGDIKANSTHGKFAADMAIRTVINALCKPIINSSTDSYILLKSLQDSEDAIITAEVDANIAEKANRELIDIAPTAIAIEGKSEAHEEETPVEPPKMQQGQEEQPMQTNIVEEPDF